MDHSSTHSKSTAFSSFTPICTNERSSTTTYGEGYVYTGPLPAQYHETQAKSIQELSKNAYSQADSQQSSTSQSSSTNNLSLSTSPSMEVVSGNSTINNNQYQFKVMLLGDSGVGMSKSRCFS